jgi:transcription-repair coupling factor (superfamily II helicase)
MALSNLKQLSVISTPPPGRKNIITWVGRDNDAIIRQALSRELQRGGQLYVIAPKISHLSALAHRIASLAPKARLALLHGRMTSQQIAGTMQQFDHRQIDILISSTIIANGLDLPHANTIIVTRATHFGLSDLYQLRGRIGRRKQQGYALFLYNQADLSSIQRQRLTALTEASRLGSGWSLARRDLEIRGAGNLLGEQQSGSVNAVGVQLYLDMVNDAIDKSSGQPALRHDLNINLPLSTHIPTEYMPDLSQRTEFYQKLSRSRTLEELTANFTQLTDQFGPAPSSLRNLYHLLQIQHLAALHQVLQIDTRRITPAGRSPFYRVIISFAKLPSAANTANKLPDNWMLNNNNLVLTTPTITPDTLQEISIILNTLN